MSLFLMSLIFLVLFIVLYNSVRTPYFTPLLLTIIWLLYSIFNYIFNKDFLFFPGGIAYISFSVILIMLGGIAGLFLANKYYDNNSKLISSNSINRSASGWHYLAIISSVLTLVGLIGLIRYSYQEFQLLNNAISLLILPQEFAADRYGGIQYLPTNIKLLSYMIYPAAVSIGALVGGRFWRQWTRLIPILLSLGYGIIYSSRTVVILTIVSLVSADWAIRVLTEKKAQPQLKKLIVLLSIAIVAFPIIFIMLQWLRQGLDSEFIFNEMVNIARTSMTGSISAFSQWYHHYHGLGFDWGQNTFAGPFELLGFGERVQGFYLDFSHVGETHINIYTAFRGLLQDFGFIGSIFFLLMFGFISAIVFYFVQKGWVALVPVLALLNGWVLFSPFISLFVNNSIIGGYILFYIFSFYPFASVQKFQLDIV